jgi:hypothetical protein
MPLLSQLDKTMENRSELPERSSDSISKLQTLRSTILSSLRRTCRRSQEKTRHSRFERLAYSLPRSRTTRIIVGVLFTWLGAMALEQGITERARDRERRAFAQLSAPSSEVLKVWGITHAYRLLEDPAGAHRWVRSLPEDLPLEGDLWRDGCWNLVVWDATGVPQVLVRARPCGKWEKQEKRGYAALLEVEKSLERLPKAALTKRGTPLRKVLDPREILY